MSVELKNIFPKPDSVCERTNQELKHLIRLEFEKNRKIDFHDMLKFFDKAVEEKNFNKASISAYYCTNALLGNSKMSGEDKAEVILSLRARLEILKGRNPNDVYLSGKG